MNERIKKMRKSLDLTQQEFADRIGSTQNVLANYESGRRNPSSSVINNICKTFNVSETWLRTGEGEMFVERSEVDELTATVERLITGESAEFKKRLVNALSMLKDEHWILLEEKLKEIVGTQETAPSVAPASVNIRTQAEKPRKDWTDAELHAELDRQLAEQREAAENPPAFWRGRSETT